MAKKSPAVSRAKLKTTAPVTKFPAMYVRMNGRDIKLVLRPSPNTEAEPSLIVGRSRMSLSQLFVNVDKGTARAVRKWLFANGHKGMASLRFKRYECHIA